MSSTMKVTVRLDDISPLITYSGNWISSSPAAGDPSAPRYSDGGSFTVTQSNAAFATIEFTGTNIQIFGSKRYNHGEYTMILDGGAPIVQNGTAQNPEEFQVSLYSSGQLANGKHALIIQDSSTESGKPFFDIDFVTIDTEVVGSAMSIEDSSKFWTFGPPGAWNTNPLLVSSFSGGNGHGTTQSGATATLSFKGSAIDVYGLVCQACGAYWVSLDGEPPVAMNSLNKAWNKPQTMLYMARNLADTDHTVTFTNLNFPTGSGLSIDYATVYGNAPAGRVSAVKLGDQSGDGTVSKTVMVGAIVGAVFAGLILVIAFVALLFLRRRRGAWPFSDRKPSSKLGSSPRASTMGEMESGSSASSVVSYGVQPQMPMAFNPLAPPVPGVFPMPIQGPFPLPIPPPSMMPPPPAGRYPFVGMGARAPAAPASEVLPEYRETPATPARPTPPSRPMAKQLEAASESTEDEGYMEYRGPSSSRAQAPPPTRPRTRPPSTWKDMEVGTEASSDVGYSAHPGDVTPAVARQSRIGATAPWLGTIASSSDDGYSTHVGDLTPAISRRQQSAKAPF